MKREPYRLRLQKALSDLFRTITPDNGYDHDLSQAVFRGRVKYTRNQDPLPMVSILENIPERSDAISQAVNAGILNSVYTLYVYGFAQNDTENPTDAGHYLLNDLTIAIASEMHKTMDPILGLSFLNMPEILKCEVGHVRNVFPPGTGQVNSETTFCILELRFHLNENYEEPPDEGA